jgi:serine/threonine protein kinase/Tol biopolymer transport system component
MALTVGTQLGSHEITALLGKGGMGEVYRARDLKLKREVAIKILPDEFSRDPDRLSRFQREAEVLASLNHPNIAGIYDLEEASGFRYLVLELVEGETLAERIQRSPVPVEEALTIAKSICEALEAAHEKGIIHRDLKPANVKITPDGKLKLLDFGLAKAIENSPTNTTLSNSPTMVSGTMGGVILGTVAYMSPEQARGHDLDQRTDIFALGCVLYEILTGRSAFGGEDVAETLSRILQSQPDWTLLPTNVQPRIRELLRLCLQKEAKRRRQAIGDVRIDIEEALSEPSTPIAVPWQKSPRVSIVLAAAVLLVVALAISGAIRLRETPIPSLPEMRLQIETPSKSSPLEFALSPDGRYIVFVASGDGPERLWLRTLDNTRAQAVAGTDGARYPFWSADSRSIGYFALGKLYRIDATNGSPKALANAPQGVGGTWNADGTILFAPLGNNTPLSRIAASGGEPVPVTRLAPGQISHRLPWFLPDGRHFFFYVQGSTDASGIYLGSLDGGEPKRLTGADTAGMYLHRDRLVFVRQGALVAQRVDVARGELMGDPEMVADQVSNSRNSNLGGFSVTNDGRVAYRAGTTRQPSQLTWFDRTGKALDEVPNGDTLTNAELSPDGRRVVAQRTLQNNPDIWFMDLIRGGFTRFTYDPAIDNFPVWSPDGMRIAFASTRKGVYSLYLKTSSGVGADELLLEKRNPIYPQDWSKDGRFLMYGENDPKMALDLWVLEMIGNERKSRMVLNTPFDERNAQFSPDGRWLAYQTNESGRIEIVVREFPEGSTKSAVSTSGGIQPRWRADGKELYFIAPDGKLMAVPVISAGSTLEAGLPKVLFPTSIVGAASESNFKAQYMVSRDGRFLINQPPEQFTTTPITLLLNWKPKP